MVITPSLIPAHEQHEECWDCGDCSILKPLTCSTRSSFSRIGDYPMLLEPQDVELFFKLHRTLMFFVNQRLKVVPDDFASPDAFAVLSSQVCLKVRDALLNHSDLIQ